MKLHDVMAGAAGAAAMKSAEIWLENPEIASITLDSRKAKHGALFFAIRGFLVDGRNFLSDAFSRGAAAAVVDSLDGIEPKFRARCLLVHDARIELARASATFFNHPTRNLLVFGVTGTNGKTSCSHILASILRAAGHTPALMGTVERSYLGRRELSDHTTQESVEIQHFLSDALKAGATAAVIEVSSHALSLSRVLECEFDAVLFNNLDMDHQDFYSGIEPYYEAKRLLFTSFNSANSKKKLIGVSNVDDRYGRRLVDEAKIPVFTFGMRDAQYSARDLQIGAAGIDGDISTPDAGKITVHSRLAPTRFNRYNITACAALAHAAGISAQAISKGIVDLSEVPGRLTRVPNTLGFSVFVDFAHSGPKLHSVLAALKEICAGKLIAVFGAGGDKDPLRRVKMGEAAAELADITVVTTDNPRSEDPDKIISAIVTSWNAHAAKISSPGILHVESDRARAIAKALQMAHKDDIVCIAGKGHEEGQIVKDKVFPFNDAAVAAQVVRELENVRH